MASFTTNLNLRKPDPVDTVNVAADIGANMDLIDAAVNGKAAAGHNHDAAYSASAHNHAGVYEPAGTVTSHAGAADPHTGYVTKALVDAKGDLIVATANDVVTRLAVGTNGHVLTADSAVAAGVKWAAAAGGGGAPPITLGYAQVTANQGSIGASDTDLTGLSVTVNVPSGARIRITGHVGDFQQSGADGITTFMVKEGATQLNRSSASALNGFFVSGDVVASLSPSAGTHTYKLAAKTSGGSLTMAASAADPAFILVEDITGGTAPSGSSVVGPDTPPSSPNAADYEFDATTTSLPSGWSWVNQGTATYDERLGAGALDLPAGGADEARHIVRAIPAASSFTLIAKMNAFSIGATGAFPSRHVVLRDSATGKEMRFSYVYGGNGGTFPEAVADYYTNTTTFNTRRGASNVILTYVPLDYVKVVKNSATSWDWYLSRDGIGWLPMHTGINVSTDLTPDQIGVGANMRARRTLVDVHHFRVT